MTDTAPRRRPEPWLLGLVLLLAAALRLPGLHDHGLGTMYYAAGVRSMLQGAGLFFYNAFDPAGFVSLDKPPVAFWIQVLFAKVLGFDGLALHLPQALAGVGSVALLYRLSRPLGAPAALVGALLLAVMPIVVAVDRSNNTDPWLIFFLLLAGNVALRGRGLSLVAAMALLGVAFNVKMLAALVAGPAILAAWLLSTPGGWARRLGWMSAAFGALVVVSLSWAAAFDLTPPDRRPYAGSSAANSMLELAVMHNGLDRFVRPRAAAAGAPPAATSRFPLYDAVPVGPLRLAQPSLAMQVAWTLPLAVLGAVLAWRRRRALVALWSLWALAYGIVYSAAGGIFHAYYLATLGPPLAALAGIGAFELWRRGPSALALGLALAAAWQAYVAGATLGWDSAWLGFPAVAALAAAGAWLRGRRQAAAIGGVALLGLPTLWTLAAIFSPGNLTLPSASLPRWLGRDDGRGPILSREWPALSDDPRLLSFLQEHRGDARFLVVTHNALLAAPVIVRTGQAAVAFGGYYGSDPILGIEGLARAVARGEVRYALVSTSRRPGDFERWVRGHGKPVDPVSWRSLPFDTRRSIELYDLGATPRP